MYSRIFAEPAVNLAFGALSGLGFFLQGVRSAGQTDEHTVAPFHYPSGRISRIESAPGNTAGWGKDFKVGRVSMCGQIFCSLMYSELYDAIFGWLEHKELRTPSREFRMMLQSYRTPNAGMPFIWDRPPKSS